VIAGAAAVDRGSVAPRDDVEVQTRHAAFAHLDRPRSQDELSGYAAIGRWIQDKRRRAALTQVQLERLSGVDQTVISRLERGKLYGLRWQRLAILVGALERADPRSDEPAPPWWVRAGVPVPASLRDQRVEAGHPSANRLAP